MKRITLFAFTCILALSTNAQSDYRKPLTGIEWVKIESNAKITIKTHDKNEILIKVSSLEPIPERAKGLKLVGVGGEDNTAVGFSVVQSGNNLVVQNVRKSQEAEIFLPKSQNVSVTNSWDGDIHIEGFSGEVEANANLNGGLSLKNLSGPITAYSLNENIKVEFETINQQAPIVLSTTNGDIDVSLPGTTPANLFLDSLNGDVYSNFDLSRPDKNGLKSISGRNIKGSINNGGVEIKLKSINGNIYLRKK